MWDGCMHISFVATTQTTNPRISCMVTQRGTDRCFGLCKTFTIAKAERPAGHERGEHQGQVGEFHCTYKAAPSQQRGNSTATHSADTGLVVG